MLTEYNFNDELYHYGVLGMKWGVHKARSYAQDTSAHRMRKKNRAAKADYKSGKITKAQYRAIKKKNKYAKEDEDIQTNIKLKAVKRKDPDKGIDSIYKSYKDTAYKEIPDYAIKRGARTAAKVLGVAGALSVGRGLHNRWVNTATAAGNMYGNAAGYDSLTKFATKNGIDKSFPETVKGYRESADAYRRAGDALFERGIVQNLQSRAYTYGAGAAGGAYAISSHKKKTRTKPKKRRE